MTHPSWITGGGGGRTWQDFTYASLVISVTSFRGGGDKFTGREGVPGPLGENSHPREAASARVRVPRGKGEAGSGQGHLSVFGKGRGGTQNSMAEAVCGLEGLVGASGRARHGPPVSTKWSGR